MGAIPSENAFHTNHYRSNTATFLYVGGTYARENLKAALFFRRISKLLEVGRRKNKQSTIIAADRPV